jgi:hypothetical protein
VVELAQAGFFSCACVPGDEAADLWRPATVDEVASAVERVEAQRRDLWRAADVVQPRSRHERGSPGLSDDAPHGRSTCCDRAGVGETGADAREQRRRERLGRTVAGTCS